MKTFENGIVFKKLTHSLSCVVRVPQEVESNQPASCLRMDRTNSCRIRAIWRAHTLWKQRNWKCFRRGSRVIRYLDEVDSDTDEEGAEIEAGVEGGLVEELVTLRGCAEEGVEEATSQNGQERLESGYKNGRAGKRPGSCHSDWRR